MNEKNKQELEQLLHEAIEDLEILPRYTNPPLPPIDIDKYKWYLRESWTSYAPDFSWLVNHFKLEINMDTKTKLLDLIKTELDPFIHENRILLAPFFLLDILSNGTSLDELLEKLLKIAIFGGIEGAVSAFNRCTTEDASTSFESIVLLEGITLEAEIEVFEGIRLVPLPSSGLVSELPPCLGSIVPTSLARFFEKTMLIIDYSIFPVFQNPFLAAVAEDKLSIQCKGFRVEVKGGQFPDYTREFLPVFHQKFCQALSIACNSGVKPAMSWEFVAEDELLNINTENTRYTSSYLGPFGDPIKVGESEIDDAKCLYKKLIDSTSNTPTNIAKKLQIPIDRWIKSKVDKDSVDKMIDLGTAFESLYLRDTDSNAQLSFLFRLRASWYLGKGKADRGKLIDEFKAIYTLRSKAVHNGELPENIKIRKGESVPTSEFIPRAQDLCLESIKKILEEGKFPDNDYWSSLILG